MYYVLWPEMIWYNLKADPYRALYPIPGLVDLIL